MTSPFFLPTLMTSPIAIPGSSSRTVATSVSPSAATSLHDRFVRRQETLTVRSKVLHPVDNDDLRLLILENISQDAVASFRSSGYTVDHFTRAMSEDELVEKIGSYHAIGIRSKTKITARVLKAATKVMHYVYIIQAMRILIFRSAPCHRLLLYWH